MFIRTADEILTFLFNPDIYSRVYYFRIIHIPSDVKHKLCLIFTTIKRVITSKKPVLIQKN